MDISVEGILVATLLILPGFLASSVERLFIDQAASEAQWIAVSALRSLGLNAAAALSLIVTVKLIAWDSLLQDFGNQLKLLTLRQAGLYLLVLYGLALIYGMIKGLLWKYWKNVSFIRRWTPISPYNDVWTDALDNTFRTKENRKLAGRPEQRCPWVCIALDEHTDIIGALTRSSMRIEPDKPFEIFLDPAYIRKDEKISQAMRLDGTHVTGAYIRVEPKMPVFVLSAPSSWRPYCDQ